ncbi:two-component sensor histidine kinase [Floricoccus tropicus]|uniref:histidine kinase n=1 Tax=Floricoccus tropicus TaxID=1859473 RepID=A0A1E8GIS7_9LACT|nr:sensor histidine kinase [Floricoccus tropicus]OFI48172.1 two-component sensor histidine kinase [Floricoccus tropicus]
MNKIKSIEFSKDILIFINFLAVVYNASLYLFCTKYIVATGASHSLLENLARIPNSPTKIFFWSITLFALLLGVIYYRGSHESKSEVLFDRFAILEIILMVGVFISLQSSYNGLVLLVFTDIFYSSKDFFAPKDKKYWLSFIILCFGMMLISNYDLLSLIIKIPSLDTYISFLPSSIKILILFLKNFLVSLNIIVFIISMVSFIMYSVTERHNIEEEVKMVSRVNTQLNNYVALTEKIAEDRERKRISREIHDTLGHALTGISAGIDAVMVLIDYDPTIAKKQLSSVSNVVREGIVDVRRSLNKLRPGALEERTLKDALDKVIKEYEDLSKINIDLLYEWDSVDLDSTKEDIIFRVIQETLTNSLRHGHANNVKISMLSGEEFIIDIQDDGVGCEEINYGYGLTQMRERLAIIGGKVTFCNDNGFKTHIEIPKVKGEMDD